MQRKEIQRAFGKECNPDSYFLLTSDMKVIIEFLCAWVKFQMPNKLQLQILEKILQVTCSIYLVTTSIFRWIQYWFAVVAALIQPEMKQKRCYLQKLLPLNSQLVLCATEGHPAVYRVQITPTARTPVWPSFHNQ